MTKATEQGASIDVRGAVKPGAVVRITYAPDEERFHLSSDENVLLATSEHPKPLEKFAWAGLALMIRHDYDLGLVD